MKTSLRKRAGLDGCRRPKCITHINGEGMCETFLESSDGDVVKDQKKRNAADSWIFMQHLWWNGYEPIWESGQPDGMCEFGEAVV